MSSSFNSCGIARCLRHKTSQLSLGKHEIWQKCGPMKIKTPYIWLNTTWSLGKGKQWLVGKYIRCKPHLHLQCKRLPFKNDPKKSCKLNKSQLCILTISSTYFYWSQIYLKQTYKMVTGSIHLKMDQLITDLADKKEKNNESRKRKHVTIYRILDVGNHLSIKSGSNPPWMQVANTIDDMTTSWHGQACPFNVNASIISHTRCTARLNVILYLYQRGENNSRSRKRTELRK